MTATKNDFTTRVQEFADLVDAQTAMRLIQQGYGSQIAANRVRVTFGRKYVRVDVGTSGRYMVDREGNIYGIKAYGVLNRGHYYGNLESIKEWNWGGHSGHKLEPQF